MFAEAWLLVLAPLAVQGRAIGASRQLWRGLVGLVSVVALLMIAAQVAYTSHVPALESVLRFLGLTKVRSRAGLAQVRARRCKRRGIYIECGCTHCHNVYWWLCHSSLPEADT